MRFRYEPESKPLDGYTIKRAIDRGGFGEVYYALSDAGKEVALKLLQDNLDVELRGIAQCLNLKHPNLLSIFDVRENDAGEHWVVMEYVSGETLDRLIRNNPTGLKPRDVEKLLQGIAGGVAYLHERGIVHRDLKPANVYRENGHIKIGDVGLAKFIAESQRSAQTQSVGTVYYMAPEIAHGRYGKEVDIYAVAVMTYEMLIGRVPFEGESTGEVLMKHLSQEPDLDVLPTQLRPVLKRALEKDPLQRTPSIEQFAKEFSNALDGVQQDWDDFRSDGVRAGDRHAASPQEARPEPEHRYGRRVGGRHTATHDTVQPWYQDQRNWWWMALAGFFAFIMSPVLIPVVFGVGIGLMPFFVIALFIAGAIALFRWIIRVFTDDYGPSHQAHRGSGRGIRLNTRYVRYQSAISERSLSVPERIAESSGSIAVAVACAALISLAVFATDAVTRSPAEAVLFGIVTALGAAAAIIPSKLWEGHATDGVMRRLITGLCGVAVGVAAFAIDDALMVDLPVQDISGVTGFIVDRGGLPVDLSTSAIERLIGYATFFGVLLVARRWWYHVDSYRPSRLRITSVFWTAVVAGLVGVIGRFPPEWAAMWGVAISTTAQLASVWVHPEHRPQPARTDMAA
ncbi:MAG: bifunctional serine/threonine protein kinase/MFS transporter [Planctomycetota bacterium]